MKNIMFIMTKLGGTGWGGAHKVSVMLANYLAQNGYKVSFSVSEPSQQDFPVDPKIKICCLSDMYRAGSIRELNNIKKLFSFRKLCKTENIDVIIGFTSNMAVYSILATVFSKRKTIISERTDPHIEPQKKILRGVRNLLFCFADKIVFQTPGAKDYFPKVVRNKSIIIPNPISDTLIPKYNGEREKRIINFCRIAPQKNLKMLLDAFNMFSQKHDDYELEIYGDSTKNDTYKNELLKYAKKLPCYQKIHFYPACSNIHEKVKNAKMFVSSSNYEGMSNSMLEAMAIGLPTIVTDCKNGGERMCIKNGENGLIVPVQNPEALTAAMLQVVDEPGVCEKLSQNGSKIRERFSLLKVFDVWNEIIDKI